MGMGQTLCVSCGQPLAEGVKFCGRCGATQPHVQVQVPHAPSSSPVNVGAQTVLQAVRPAMPLQTSHGPSPQPVATQLLQPLPASTMVGVPSPLAPNKPAPGSPSPLAMQKTMMGMPESLGPEPVRSPPAAAPAPLPAPAPRAAAFAPLAPLNRTMLGVAMPGIAPTQPPSEDAPPPPPSSFQAPVEATSLPPRRPQAMTLPLQVQYVPPPEPLREHAAPAPPRIVRKKGGVPLSAVALVTGGVVLAGGLALAILWRGAPPITGQPRATPDGRDVLHLVCEPKSCKDGTVVALGGMKTTFMAGEADLQLAAPLHVGDNVLELMVDRPGMGRDETVKLVVPVAYRVSADVTTMSAPHPAVTIRVEARPGTEATVDGKPLALDASGVGTYAIDERSATEGAADESRVVSVEVPYTVATQGHAPEKGTVSARVAVAPLRVDSPGARAIVDEDKVLVAGRAAKGASVTVDGAAVTVGPDGAFETLVPMTAPGDRTVDVRGEVHGAAGTLMPRTVHVTVSRVASLADAAKDFEQQKPLGYDAAMSDIVGKTGQPIVVDGQVIESRGSGHRTLALVDDKRGCTKSPCLTRVVVFRDLPLAHGDSLRAYGFVARGFTTPAGQTIPEVDSLFVQRTKR